MVQGRISGRALNVEPRGITLYFCGLFSIAVTFNAGQDMMFVHLYRFKQGRSHGITKGYLFMQPSSSDTAFVTLLVRAHASW